MENLPEILHRCFDESTLKCVLSNPKDKNATHRKITLRHAEGVYYVEKYTATQVFHDTLSYTQAQALLSSLLGSAFRNLNAWTSTTEYSIQISKKGKVLFLEKENALPSPPAQSTHNRQKNYLLAQGTHIAPLVDMGIFTKEGKVVQSMYDKYKQINRFIEIVDDEVRKSTKTKLRILDFGCGKSYLTFVLYHYFTQIRALDVEMIGLDLKEDVIKKCNAAAQKYGYSSLRFEVGDISTYATPDDIDIVITLHACDTATDYALHHAICRHAGMIFSVPCCQHELNAQLSSDALSLLSRYGLVKERFSALLTDAIRCNLLEHCGYKTQIIEFVPFDHTPKNLLIRAVKKGTRSKTALSEALRAVAEFNVDPTLLRLLKSSGHVTDT